MFRSEFTKKVLFKCNFRTCSATLRKRRGASLFFWLFSSEKHSYYVYGIRSLVRGFTSPGFHLSVVWNFTCPEVHLSRGSVVRRSVVRRFTCPGVHLSVLFVYYIFLPEIDDGLIKEYYVNRSWIDKTNTRAYINES